MSFDFVRKQTEQPSWIRYIRGRIGKKQNFIAFISGATGSGKSYSSLSIAEMLDEDFTIERCVFSGRDFMRLLNSGELKNGSVIVWEELGVGMSSRDWQSIVNKAMVFVLQTFRHRRLVVIMNAPYMDFVDVNTRKLFHAEWRTVGINREKKKVILSPKLIQYNSRIKKFYYKYLIVVTPKLGGQKVERWGIPLPSEELLRLYEVKKESFTTALNKKVERDITVAEEGSGAVNKRSITEEEIIEWEKMRKDGAPYAKIAGQFNRNASYVAMLLNKRRYALDNVIEASGGGGF